MDTARIAGALPLPRAEKEMAVLGALLHDVGSLVLDCHRLAPPKQGIKGRPVEFEYVRRMGHLLDLAADAEIHAHRPDEEPAGAPDAVRDADAPAAADAAVAGARGYPAGGAPAADVFGELRERKNKS